MSGAGPGGAGGARGLSGWQRVGPIVTLLVLSPVIGEVLSGATLLSYIFVLVPEIMVWGCGTLIIRDAVRRWRGRWPSTLLLGMGLAIAEEFIIQQTSLAPPPWLGSGPVYGRVWGVTWPYFIFMLGYEALWIVLVPIQVTELVFARSQRREEPWLSTRGLVAAGAAFVVGSFIAWFLWTQIARTQVFHVRAYHPPALTVGLGALAIVALAVAAWASRGLGRRGGAAHAPRPWALAAAAALFGFPWYLLMAVLFAPRHDLPLWVPMVAAGAWAALALLVMGRWVSAPGWRDEQLWALSFGALVVNMSAGFLGAAAWSRADTVAKAVFNVAAVAGMVLLRRRLADGAAAGSPPTAP